MKIIKTKVFKILLVLFCIGFILGIISFFIINTEDKSSIQNNLLNYISNIRNDDFNYSSGILNSIISNIKYLSIIWISGIIFILVFIVPFITLFKGILTSFTIISIINTFGIKGLLYSFIIMFPCELINIFLILLMSYYSIHFSLKCYKAVKYNKYINLKDFIKNYILIFIILSFISIINSFIEIFFISNILKFVV